MDIADSSPCQRDIRDGVDKVRGVIGQLSGGRTKVKVKTMRKEHGELMITNNLKGNTG